MAEDRGTRIHSTGPCALTTLNSMKKTPLLLVAAFCAAPLAYGTVTVEDVGGVSLPRDGSLTGASWTNASNNRMAQIKSRSNTQVGTNRVASIRQDDFGDYTGLIVSNFNSWKAVAEDFPGAPSQEWGNQYNRGIWIYGDTDFFPADYTVSRQWETWNSNTLVWEDFGAASSTRLNTSNNVRVRYGVGTDGVAGTSDDQQLSSQNMSLPTRSLIFVGPAMALTAGGSEDNQQAIENTLSFARSKHLAAKITVTNTTTNTIVKTIWVGGSASAPAAPIISSSGHTQTGVSLEWADVDGELAYRVETSSNGGVNWTAAATVAPGTTSYTVSGLNAGTGYSFRVIAVGDPLESTSNTLIITTSLSLEAGDLVLNSDGTTTFKVTGPATGSEQVHNLVEWSTDLINWSPAPAGTVVTGSGTTWSVVIPAPRDDRRFFRSRWLE